MKSVSMYELRAAGACFVQRQIFIEVWPNGYAEMTEENCIKAADAGLDDVWYVNIMCPFSSSDKQLVADRHAADDARTEYSTDMFQRRTNYIRNRTRAGGNKYEAEREFHELEQPQLDLANREYKRQRWLAVYRAWQRYEERTGRSAT